MDDDRTVFWLTICKLNSVCGETSEEAREQSTIPSAGSSKFIVAVAGMKKTQEEDCWWSDLPCMKSYTGFFFPDHVLTYTQSLQLGWVPTWAASISKKKKKTKKRFQCCQRCMMGKAREEIRRDKQMRWCRWYSWCSWCSVPSATHLMVRTGKQCLISQLIEQQVN